MGTAHIQRERLGNERSSILRTMMLSKPVLIQSPGLSAKWSSRENTAPRSHAARLRLTLVRKLGRMTSTAVVAYPTIFLAHYQLFFDCCSLHSPLLAWRQNDAIRRDHVLCTICEARIDIPAKLQVVLKPASIDEHRPHISQKLC